MKTILITGATAGIGEAAARKFAGGEWRVIGTGRRGDRLRALQDELGDAFLPLEIDMRDIAAVESLAKLADPWSGIDLLLNNAGLAPPTDPLPETEWERIEDVIETNVTGLVALTRALLPRLIERKGAIINLSSVAATYPYKGGAVYAAPILTRPEERPARQRGTRDLDRAGHGGNRVHCRPYRRRQGSV